LLQPEQPIPTLVTPSSATPATFEDLELAAPLLRGLAGSGFIVPTEIQALAIPPALAGRDVLASAQTGTGKTAAFVLPALQRLLAPPAGKGRGPRVLVLTPTRELAGQVSEVIASLGRATKLRSGSIVGGVSYEPQERLLRNPLDLLVATPGRLIDHMERGLVDFSRVELFVLDEADRMLDMGFIRPVQQIAAALPKERQTLLFSATLEGGVHAIAQRLQRQPVQIELASVKVRHAAIEQRLHLAGSSETKHALLRHLLADPELTQAIVFTATKRGADRLAKRLGTQGVACAPLHGNMRQSARDRTVNLLRSGKVQVLVATDVASRGIDILGVSHVINFDLPTVAEDYIHRIGRTGRNGATGIAISLVGPEDRVKLAAIQRLTGERLTPEGVKGLGVHPAGGPAAPFRLPDSPAQRPAQREPARPRAPQGGSGARRTADPAARQGAPAPRQSMPAARQSTVQSTVQSMAAPAAAPAVSGRGPSANTRTFRPRRRSAGGW
jgi:superfamily II DNA/RNA helicase